MFDRTKPVNGTTVDADLLRGNMNDLDDRVSAIVPIPGEKGEKGDPGKDGSDGQPGIQGPPGADGATAPAANLCGAWVAGQGYNKSDAVVFNGLMYLATTAIMSPWSQPDTNPEWQLLTIIGPQGEAGGMNFPVTTDAVFQARVMIQQSELHLMTNTDTGSGESAAFIAATDHGSGPVVQIGARVSGADAFRHDLDLGNGVQHGDIPQFDDASKAWRPTRGVTQDIMVPRLEGGYTVLHFASGLLMSTEIGA